MKYKGYEITAEVEAYEQWTIDESGANVEFVGDTSVSGDITGYFFVNAKAGDDFFETSKMMNFEMLKDIIDDHIKELAAGPKV